MAAFSTLQGGWVSQAAAHGFAPDDIWDWVPALDGVLSMQPTDREASSRDQGNLVSVTPEAVLYPASIEDIVKMVRFCKRFRITVAARGQHHTMHGQSLATGLVIEMTEMYAVHHVSSDSAVVDAGLTFKDLLLETVQYGLRPPVKPGYSNLTIGGVLSVGGCPQATQRGAIVDNVRKLWVVTGEGDLECCSPWRNRDLFQAALGGLGQCGIIVKAEMELVPALPMARTYYVRQPDHASMFQDMRTLLERDEMDEILTLCVPPGSNQFIYQTEVTVFYDPATPPDDAALMRDLNVPLAAIEVVDRSYVDFALVVDGQIDFLRATFNWDQVPKPWFDVWMPDDEVEAYTGDVLGNLTPEDVGPFGFILIFAIKRSEMQQPYLRVPDTGKWVWLFDLLTAAGSPDPGPGYTDRLLARNRELYERAVAVGGTRYPIGAIDFDKHDWREHYGPVFPRFARAKRRYDPRNILTPGPGIFPPRRS